jgi:hypothetical protein
MFFGLLEIKLEIFQRYLCLVSNVHDAFPLHEIFQIAELDWDNVCHWMGTFEHGDENVDSAI